MPAKLPSFATKDEIPETFRDSYVEKDGKWVPDVEDVSGLKASQKAALDEKKKLEDSLKLSLGGRSLEDVAELLKKQQDAEEELARKKGDVDSLVEKGIKRRFEELQAQRGFTDDDAKAAIQKLADYEYRDQVSRAALGDDIGINPKRIDAVIKLTRDDHIRRDKSGKLIVVDDEGDPTGETLEKFFGDRFKKAYPELYLGSQSSGGGSSGGNGEGRAKGTQAGTVDGSNADAMRSVSVDDVASGKVKVALPE